MKPVDMVVAAKLVSAALFGITYQGLAEALEISTSEAHASAQRLMKAGLFRTRLEADRKVPYPYQRALLEFWIHGVKYLYPPEHGAPTRGVPTSIGAPPLAEQFAQPDGGPPVWPSATGLVRGPALQPIHKSALPASSDTRVYELLALIDALREGRSREAKLAQDLLRERVGLWA
ncbi:hypothetical protein ACFFLM_05895 [Deinococcus oregonensis]|uniref:MarR family transcriptional regulator n=1 Tax=Deinococcus oregonensis TaxID=1805970 RepID=A0ABV6AVI3_9DEIO